MHRVLPAVPLEPEEIVILLFVMTTIVFVGLAAIALAQPPRAAQIPVWSDDVERRLLRERSPRLRR